MGETTAKQSVHLAWWDRAVDWLGIAGQSTEEHTVEKPGCGLGGLEMVSMGVGVGEQTVG